MIEIYETIAKELKLDQKYTENAINLLHQQECTIAFVARYRKEQTGSMNEVTLRQVKERHQYLLDFNNIKTRYLKVIHEQASTNPNIKKKLPELELKFASCRTKQELEDLYLPFKPKRRTKAQMAREAGLTEIVDYLFTHSTEEQTLLETCQGFITEKKLTISEEKALQGASDILSETINENAEVRNIARKLSFESASLMVSKIEPENNVPEKILSKLAKYENYFNYEEPIAKAATHRIMAIRRGESEKFLRVKIKVDKERILEEIYQTFTKSLSVNKNIEEFLKNKVVVDSYSRLLAPSIETEIRLNLKSSAETEAIKVFARNLSKLLMLPPMPEQIILAVDPGLRTGSKIAILSKTGALLDHLIIHPNLRDIKASQSVSSIKQIQNLIEKHKVTCIALGNGTGSREVDAILNSALAEHEQYKNIRKIIVNESGASVYSTDEIAREEFPDLDPTIRSAISIGRRILDPLAELVKIDPRSVGVGQYQHDCNVTKLNTVLSETVESCVNNVGADLNTASYKLLEYISGISKSLAKNIIEYRDKNGKFSSRQELHQVKGFGPKSYEQSAGFLRVVGSEPLDNSSVHPERYELVNKIAQDQGVSVEEIIGKKELVEAIKLENYITDKLGLPTLKDICQELIKPGRDPRKKRSTLNLSKSIKTINDLKENMQIKGTVSNVTNFGVFVDLGIHQDGLIHISELSDQFVKDPSQLFSVGDIVSVRVLNIDYAKKRISLSRKTHETNERKENKDSKEHKNIQIKPSKSRGQRRAPSSRNTNNRNRKKSAPEKQYSVGDLLNKFNLRS